MMPCGVPARSDCRLQEPLRTLTVGAVSAVWAKRLYRQSVSGLYVGVRRAGVRRIKKAQRPSWALGLRLGPLGSSSLFGRRVDPF